MRKPWILIAVLLFLGALLLGGLVGDRVLALTDEVRDALRLYTELVSLTEEHYGAEVKYRDLVYESIHGMLRALDPHTNFLTPEAYADMRDRQAESFYGLGILVGMRNGQLTVITPIEGTPASRLGIRAGDVISHIEGEPTSKMTLQEAVQRLKGPKDTQVRITVVRPGMGEPLKMVVTRAEIPQSTVRNAYMLEPGTGYIRITDFNRSTGQEVADAIDQLKQQGMKRLLLDLRQNGGGLLDQAVEVADQFVPKGSDIVETRGRNEESLHVYKAAGRYSILDLPVVVLVNRGTASAAEIVSGAIQDHDVGLVVGTPTWGKGLVQTVYSLSYGAGLALTTAKYYTPSGRLIQRDYSSYYDYYAYAGTADDLPDEMELPDQVYLTDLGREVYGGGGITPDEIVAVAEISPFLQYLLSRNAFFEFAVEYQNLHPVEDPQWRPDGEVLERFQQWLIDNEITTGEEMEEGLADEESKEYVSRQIRAEIFNAAFGLDAQHRVLAEGDAQIQTALKLFGRAEELLAQRRSLEEEEEEGRQVATLP